METNKENKRKTIYILLGLLLLAGWFYWFQWRPSQIRKRCEWSIFSEETVSYRGAKSARQNNKYRHCLIKNGLKPESLFVNTE